MTHTNFNPQEVINNSNLFREMCQFLDGKKLKITKKNFKQKYGYIPTLANAQVVFELFVDKYYDNCITLPKKKLQEERKMYNRIKPLYVALIKYKIDVYSAGCRFIEFHNNSFIECPDRIDYWFNPLWGKKGYVSPTCGEIVGRKPLQYIVNQELNQKFITWAIKNKKHLKNIINQHIKIIHILHIMV